MAPTLAVPDSVEEAPEPLRWTRAEYFRMAALGLLPQDPGTELIHGTIYRKTSQATRTFSPPSWSTGRCSRHSGRTSISRCRRP